MKTAGGSPNDSMNQPHLNLRYLGLSKAPTIAKKMTLKKNEQHLSHNHSVKLSTVESHSPFKGASPGTKKKVYKVPQYELTNEEIDTFVDEVKNKTL